MALDVTSRNSLSTSEPLQSLMTGPISNGSIEHILSNYSTQTQQQQSKQSMEDATLFLKAAAAAAAAAAAVSASETAASPCPTTSSLPESPKSQSLSLLQRTSLEADESSMGRPESISPSQPLALTGHRFAKSSVGRSQSPLNVVVECSPLEKLQSISPTTISGVSKMGTRVGTPTRSLKFSIDNILSPEFGKNEANRNLFLNYYQHLQEKYSSLSNLVKSSSNSHQHQSVNQKLSFDINTLVSGKRKRSDSESSSVSSMSNNSKETTLTTSTSAHCPMNVGPMSNHTNKKYNKNARSETASPSEDKAETLDEKTKKPTLWPAWVYCTRYSDRPSSVIRSLQSTNWTRPSSSAARSTEGPRSRKMKKKEKKDEKRPRTAFTAEQLARLKQEFIENRYLNEKRRQDLARELKLNESQIKIWFQNKRAKIKKSSGSRNPLAMHLMAQGLYNHSTMAIDSDDEFDDKSPSPQSPQSESSKTG